LRFKKWSCNVEDHLEVVKYIYNKGLKFHNSSVTFTAKRGHLEVIKHLYDMGVVANKGAIEWAAGNGHLEVVKYLHSVNTLHSSKTSKTRRILFV
jgi:hypothetical protein